MSTCYNPFSLEGKTILVTGASSGIGKQIAIDCSRMGATVIITGRNKERLNETFEQLIKRTSNKSVLCDISSAAGVKFLVPQVDKLDGLVLAAGIVEMLPATFATREKFDKIYNTNLFSPIDLLRNIIKQKKYNKPFAVVAITSVAGLHSIATANGIYGSGKAALFTILKYFAKENASKDTRINTVSPGMILTPMHTAGVVEEDQLEKVVENIPIKRWGKPEDVSNAVIYLLSDASSYITGSEIVVDGGLTI